MTYTKVAWEIGSVIICLIIGALSFKSMPNPWKLLYFQILSYFVFYIASNYVTIMQEKMHLKPNDHYIFNIYMLFDTFLPCISVILSLEERHYKRLIWFFLCIFSILYLYFVFKSGLNSFLNYICVASSICLFLTFTLFLYLLTKNTSNIFKIAKVWACIGFVISAACIIPYMSMIHVLNNLDEVISKTLFLIVEISGNIRYGCLAVAFWLIYTTQKKQTLVQS